MARDEMTLDQRAQALGWENNAEMTHQAHRAPAFGCTYCHPHERSMWANVTTQGTAMPESALCGQHEASRECVATATANAAQAGDRDGRARLCVDGNDALACTVCGYVQS